MEPAQWITAMYNSGIMNLLDIPHFGHGKNVGHCVKQFLAWVHGDNLCMDRPVHIDVVLIAKTTGLSIVGAQPKEYLDNKARKKEIVELVKAQFGTSRGNMGIVLRDINDNATRFANNIMACKLLRKCKKEEAPARVITVAT
jgi:hypothetical protein